MQGSDGMMAPAQALGGWGMLSEVTEFVVQGITVEGEIFQPPDWAERLCDKLSRVGADGRKAYPSYTRPILSEGVKSLAVRASLQKDNIQAFELIRQFIAENRLTVRSGRGSRDAEAAELPFPGKERRDPSRNIW